MGAAERDDRDPGQSGRARLARLGVLPLTDGVELFDLARGMDDALVVPVRLDVAALAGQASAGALPPFLSAMVRAQDAPRARWRGFAGAQAGWGARE